MKSPAHLLFLHSALGVSQDLKPLMDYFSSSDLNLLSFEFSGHGKTAAWPEDFRIDTFAKELEAFFKAKNLQRVSIFGHSLGGYVALYHKVNYEDSPIDNIITYGTKFNWSKDSVAKEIQLLNPDHLSEKYPKEAQTLFEKHGERWKHLMRSTAHMLQHLEKLDGLTREDLMDVEIPVTLIVGDQDRMVTKEETNLAKSWLHHAEVRVISHSKHDLERSNLKEIASVIKERLL
jgi:pimeloyl-ACP methyl ester carboxylesterase